MIVFFLCVGKGNRIKREGLCTMRWRRIRGGNIAVRHGDILFTLIIAVRHGDLLFTRIIAVRHGAFSVTRLIL